MKLTNEIKAKALIHAKEEFPKESVGLVHVVKGRKKYFPCQNLADTPDEDFVLDPKDYLEAEEQGQVIAVVHSHPKVNHHPSLPDRVACEKSGLPWFIVNPQTELWGECAPEGYELPYVGRPFSHGIIDCYSLVRDYYKKEFKIDLRDYDRRDQWWEKGENLYLENFKKEGFGEIPLEEVKKGDLFLMKLSSNTVNHAGIYLGDNIVLHHVQARLSSRDVYGGYYQKITEVCIRHESR